MTDGMFRSGEETVTLLGRRSLMNEIKNKDGAMSKAWQMTMAEPVQKKPRTSEDFKLFCQFILAYENYDSDKDESQDTVVSSADESVEKADDSSKYPDHNKPQSSTDTHSDTDNDSFDLVTCFCGKPFAGRPMIECSKCLTWIHLRCAKVKKSDIPEVFICSHCKGIHKSDE